MNRVPRDLKKISITKGDRSAVRVYATHVRNLLIWNIASPYGLAAISFFIFVAAYFFPPALYTRYLDERDFLFLDPASLLFFLLCMFGFCAGLLVVDVLYPLRGFTKARRTPQFSATWFVLLPVAAATIFTVFSCAVLLRDNAYLLELLLSAQASQLKTEGGMQVNGPISQAAPMLMGVVWWALWRKGDEFFSGRQKLIVNLSLFLATIALFVSATLMVSRGELMPIIAGIATVIMLRRLKDDRFTLSSLFKFGMILTISVMFLFTAFSMLRGQSDPDILIGDILGYSLASYNRLAALLAGKFHYPFSGRGIYISAFVAFNKSFNYLFHVNRLFDWPDFDTVWLGEFDAVSAAGLNGRLIWSGTFGYIYSDFGWFSPLILFLHGLIAGWAWRMLRLGKTAGVVLYPWCAFCILYWFGTNYLLDPKVVDLVLVAIALSIYESLFSRERKEMSPQ